MCKRLAVARTVRPLLADPIYNSFHAFLCGISLHRCCSIVARVADFSAVPSESHRKAVLESVTKVSDSMMDGINFGVARVFSNQKKIEAVRFFVICHQWLSFFVAPSYIVLLRTDFSQHGMFQETKVLEAQTNRFLKLTSQWSQMIEDFNEALKVCLW